MGKKLQNTAFAKWLRHRFANTVKPTATTHEGWREWRAQYKQQSPILYWITEKALSKMQRVIEWPGSSFNNIRYYWVARFVEKTHVLNTKLPPGKYYGLNQRILHGLFESLVDFVEVEKAWMQVVFDKNAWNKYGYPKWYRLWWLRWTKKHHCPQAGLDYLAWEISLAEPNIDEFGTDHSMPLQSAGAQETYDLYNWWKNIRPLRPDPYEASGFTEWCKTDEFRTNRNDEDVKAKTKNMIDAIGAMEQEYDDEDTDMMIRLIKLRNNLWT